MPFYLLLKNRHLFVELISPTSHPALLFHSKKLQDKIQVCLLEDMLLILLTIGDAMSWPRLELRCGGAQSRVAVGH